MATLALASCTSALAAPGESTVIVTGSVLQQALEEAPYAIGVVERDALRVAGPMLNLSEAMSRVPGVVVANRNNYAQDLQISSRGFGARAGFGVRGIRLYTDGIPATGPDGQGQVSHFDIADAGRVEVLRGPFSVLYGNSSGGVISTFSAPVREPQAEGAVDAGSFGLRQLRGVLATPLAGGFDLRVSAAAMEIGGFRPHSAAQRELANARLAWRDEGDSVTVLAGLFRQPAQDPLGLTRAQFDADPLQTDPAATLFDTRKDAAQQQIGASWKHRFGDGALRDAQLAVYGGRRAVTQFQAIPVATQVNNPGHGGGVVDFDRNYGGAEGRLRWAWTNVDVMAGLALDDQRDQRRGYENFSGSGSGQVLGVAGRLRRDETDHARSSDLFAQAEWALANDVGASFGLRSGQVRLAADDHYLSNGDDSGSRRFSYTSPVAGLRWQPTPGLHLYASAARGFESPTLGELAYREDGSSGFNTGLQPQTSRQIEVGAKWRRPGIELDLALFEARVADEIGVAINSGGRSAYQNVGRTLRRGAELAAGWQPAPAWQTRLALTWLDAHYQDDFVTCAGIPCNLLTGTGTATVPAGNRIAGTQRGSAYGEVAWHDADWGDWGAEWRAAARTAVNDVNSDFAAGYGLASLRWSRTLATAPAGPRLEALVRVDNVFDRRYSGTVIVNDANGRYFETAAPRNLLLALRLVGGL